MNTFSTEITKAWWSFELPEYRPHPTGFATYSWFEYEKLPPILQPLNGDFAWLRNEPQKGDSIEHANCQLDRILDTIHGELPAPFVEFMCSSELQSRIRSCTACYLDTADRAVQAYGIINGTLIHFLSDQQWCLHWYLLIDTQGNHVVVVSGEAYGFIFQPEETEEAQPSQASMNIGENDIQYCAPSFEAFMYRFWLENEIWYALAFDQAPLSERQQAYVDHYASID